MKISEKSKSEDLGEVVSSASNDHLDNTGVKSSRLIVDLSEIARKRHSLIRKLKSICLKFVAGS